MGNKTPVLSFPDVVHAVALVAGISRQVTVPVGSQCVLMNATGDFWVAYGRPAVLPSADVLDGSAAELNPTARAIPGVCTLGMVAPANCLVSLAFFG